MPRPLPVEALRSLAERAVEGEEHAKALPLIQEARAQAPTSTELRNLEAFARGRMGQRDRAFTLYKESHEAGSKDAAVEALCLASVFEDRGAALHFIPLAVERNPAGALDIIDDDDFLEDMANEPTVRARVHQARRATQRRGRDA